MAHLRASWRTSLPVVQQPRNPQSESMARSPYQTGLCDSHAAVRSTPPEFAHRPRAAARRSEAAHSGAPGRDGCGAVGRCGRAASRMRDGWTAAGQQGPFPCDLPLLVRRRAGPGPTVTRLPLSGSRRAEELRGSRSRRGSCPELAYVTTKFAALVPFGKFAALLSELLPI